MDTTYDFIIIGAGASGSVLSSRLAHLPSSPRVLLLEAGGPNTSTAYLSGPERFALAFAPNSPLNWGYKTTPQTQLVNKDDDNGDSKGPEIDYSRGKGLGGSTAINFCGWTIGPREDWDEWADIVDGTSNDSESSRFRWSNVQSVLRRITNLDTRMPSNSSNGFNGLLHVNPANHGTQGNLKLSYGDKWMRGVQDIYTAAQQAGHTVNPDVNSGDPIGMGMGSVCIAEGVRETSATAYLSARPENLDIVVDAHVQRVVFEEEIVEEEKGNAQGRQKRMAKKAVAVETTDGRLFTASKEIILSAGALNTPQLLLLSGIGPAAELSAHGIPLICESPHVGKNLQDHCFAAVGIVMEKTKEELDAEGGEGEPTSQSPTPMGWFKLPALMESEEYKMLPDRVKRHIQRKTVPSMELASHTTLPLSTPLSPPLLPTETTLTCIALPMTPQSRGTITLSSSPSSSSSSPPSPLSPPLIKINPSFLTHPFDTQSMLHSLRLTLKILSSPIYAHRTTRWLSGISPSSTDAQILAHARRELRSSWHMSCSARMGKSSEDGVVDSRFRVFGVQGLRIVDLSVCPFVVNAHTQSVAYVVGELGADVLAEDWGLGEVGISGKREDGV